MEITQNRTKLKNCLILQKSRQAFAVFIKPINFVGIEVEVI